MARVERPLSPHLGIYRWQVTNTLSILHRLTGLYVSLGIVVLVLWLVALAAGPEAYASAAALIGSGWFKLPMLGWMLCFFYHLANGIRHLFWDSGKGFSDGAIHAGGWAVVAFSVVATGLYAFATLL